MAIAHTDITGVDADLARRVLALARTIVPCLDSLVDEPRDTAIAILKSVALDGVARGSRQIASQRTGLSSVTYVVNASWFSSDDRSSLRGLCGAASEAAGTPIGSFPTGRFVAGIWPEDAPSRSPLAE